MSEKVNKTWKGWRHMNVALRQLGRKKTWRFGQVGKKAIEWSNERQHLILISFILKETLDELDGDDWDSRHTSGCESPLGGFCLGRTVKPWNTAPTCLLLFYARMNLAFTLSLVDGGPRVHNTRGLCRSCACSWSHKCSWRFTTLPVWECSKAAWPKSTNCVGRRSNLFLQASKWRKLQNVLRVDLFLKLSSPKYARQHNIMALFCLVPFYKILFRKGLFLTRKDPEKRMKTPRKNRDQQE